MPLVQKISHEHGFVYAHWTGHLTLGDLAKGYEDYLALPGAADICLCLHDMRQAEELAVFENAMKMLGDVVREDAMMAGRARRSAAVINDPRILSEVMHHSLYLSEEPSLQMRVFDDLGLALDWLGLPRDLDLDALLST